MRNRTESEAPLMVACPECGRPSDSIKSYWMMDLLVFILAFVYHRRKKYVCCPRCMRKHLLVTGFTYNIVLANLLWLMLILPWTLILLAASFTGGHSSEVYGLLESDGSGDCCGEDDGSENAEEYEDDEDSGEDDQEETENR